MKERVAVQESRLLEHMQRLGVSVRSLAQRVGIKQETLRRFIKGETSPNMYTGILIADALLVKDVRQIWSVQIVNVDIDTEENS